MTVLLVLYRDNRLDGRWEISAGEVASGFLASRWRVVFEQGWPLDRALLTYIGSSEGLGSSFDTDEGVNQEAFAAARAEVFTAIHSALTGTVKS